MQKTSFKIKKVQIPFLPLKGSVIRQYYPEPWMRTSCDIDILVDFEKDAHVGLFKYAGMYSDLKEILGREVDLVKNGTLKSFTVESANNDKILIYERGNLN